MKVELLDIMGGDETVVNAARVSMNKTADKYTKRQNDNLIDFLAKGMDSKEFNAFVTEVMEAGDADKVGKLLMKFKRKPEHWAPCAHSIIQFRVKAPLFVARQLWKSHIGLACQDESVGWSEISRRYVDDEPEFYVPEVWRKRADNVKQGSSDEAHNGVSALAVAEMYELIGDAYREMISEEIGRAHV